MELSRNAILEEEDICENRWEQREEEGKEMTQIYVTMKFFFFFYIFIGV